MLFQLMIIDVLLSWKSVSMTQDCSSCIAAPAEVAFRQYSLSVRQEQLLAREHRAETARTRKKQAAAEAAAGKSSVTGVDLSLCMATQNC